MLFLHAKNSAPILDKSYTIQVICNIAWPQNALPELCVRWGLGQRLNKQKQYDSPVRNRAVLKHVGTLALLARYLHRNKLHYSTYKKGKINMNAMYTSIDQLPMTLCAEHVAMALGISRAGAYTLLHSKGFPTIKIGKRLVVPRDKFIKWMEMQTAK